MDGNSSWDTKAKLDAFNLIDTIDKIHRKNIEKNENEELFFWEEENAKIHIRERKYRKHLPENATMDDYNIIIESILTNDPDMSLHSKSDRYVFGKTDIKNGEDWIVILTKERSVITAYKTDKPEDYFSHFSASNGYFKLGTYYELVRELDEE
ncbi:hypothetical protein [Gottfriedia acidiceleris]|uniref:Uncharacterized protein n=1 Tax=Gottfriedia acidiceleris TaxID=371036 RepID=A0ABY4JL14_9BACI|nr:hypothetical protein [Gottfriedia acidiceleris]UPM54521.1 hypothetical protein MY490_01035 [Gottfriedia acidiceleris]